MLKEEWRQFLTNRKLLISIIVMMFIPIIYGGIFLSASWDPFGKTDRLAVAVVNNDVQAELEGKTLRIGDELVERLKTNDDLDWHFINEKDAKKGMNSGDYHMVITIPEDFSKNAATVLDNNPKQMNLTYDINPGRGYTVETISKQVTKNIKNQIAESVTKEYVRIIFAQMNEMGEGFSEAAEGTKQMDEGLAQLQEGNLEIAENSKRLASSSLTFKNGADEIQVGFGEFVTGANKLNDGATQLNKGVKAYTSGVSQLQSNLGDLSANLINGLTQLQKNASKLVDASTGIPKLSAGQSDLNEGISQLVVGNVESKDELQQLSDELPTETQIIQLKDGLSGIETDINQLQNVVPSGSDTSEVITEITTNLTSVQTTLTNLQEISKTDGHETLIALQSTDTYATLTSEQRNELNTAIQQEVTKQAEAQQNIAQTLASSISELSTQLTANIMPILNNLGEFPEQVTALNTAVQTVNPNVIEALNGYSTIRNSLVTKLIPSATSLSTGLDDAVSSGDQLAIMTANLNKQAPLVVSGINQIANEDPSFTDGIAELALGSDQLIVDVSKLQVGSFSLQEGLTKYSLGVSAISEGANKLVSGSNELSSQGVKLNNGSKALDKGAEQLVSKLPSIRDGMNQLTDGAGQISKGAEALASGSIKLGDGMGTLKSGSGILYEKLSEGANAVKDIQPKEDNYSMIAAPTTLIENQLSTVPNYGHALAPYMLSLGLYIGAMGFNLIFPVGLASMKPTSGLAWWFSKFSVGVVQAMLAALILDAIMILGLGLEVDNIGQFILISLLISLAYMSLIMFFAIIFGNAGRFIVMVFFILQLVASGGMFPIELTNRFFYTINPYLPMTYAVNGFRTAISSAYGNTNFVICILFLIGCTVVFNVLILLFMNIWKRKEVDFNNKTEFLA